MGVKPPIRARPEPKTSVEIREEIAFLTDRLQSVSSLDQAIRERIEELKKRMP